MSIYSSLEVYPSDFDDVFFDEIDVDYEHYLSCHPDERSDDQLREMYDEYYSCYGDRYSE